MKFTRKATATWNGTIKEGSGHLSTQSTTLSKAQYSFKTRFEEGVGTNPEELIGAAHAGCFTMQLDALLSEEDYRPETLTTEAQVKFQDGEIVEIILTLTGKVDGIENEQFMQLAEKAKSICPISKLLKTKITLEAQLS